MYKGVEIRTRCAANPRNSLWTGNYAFFTRTIANLGNDRICRELAGRFATEEEAVAACFEEARQAVDREISARTSLSPFHPLPPPAPMAAASAAADVAAAPDAAD
jgi:hypothetical protein